MFSFVHLSTYTHLDAILLPSTLLSNPIYSNSYLCTDTYLTAILLTNSVSSKPLNPPNYLCKSINSAVVLLLTPSVNKKVYYCARQCTDIFSIVFPTPKTTFNKHLYGFTYFCKIINSAVVLLPKPSVNNKVYYCALLCTDIFSVVLRTPKTTFNKHLYCYSYLCADMEDPFASEGEEEMLPVPSKDTGRRTEAGSISSSSASTSSTVLPAASASSITSLAQQIRKIKNAASAPRVLGGHHTIRTKNYSSLIADSTVDGRSKMSYHRELYDAKINMATSFDPSSLTCYNCDSSPHPIMSANGQSDPTCFILSDQCFPPALPSLTEARCLAIIRVEDASLSDLVKSFMRLTRGCNLAIGSVVVISSLNHLGCVGSAAYAEDLVEALAEFRNTFRGQVRAVHGYPVVSTPVVDPATIRGLLEIEAWLASVDHRRAHSLRSTSEYYINTLLDNKKPTETANPLASISLPIRMPASLFSKERTAFVGLGWPNMATIIHPLSSSDEQLLLSTMLHELNLEFAMQLDTNPCTDRLLTTSEVIRSKTIIIGGGSHAGRIAEAIRSTHPEVVDLSMSGWLLSENTASELASDISDALDDEEVEDPIVVLQIFDNALYKGTLNGEIADPVKQQGRYHILGNLQILTGHELKLLFETAMPILRAARGARIILIGPLPRYVVGRCCSDSSHLTNYDEEDYVKYISNSLKEVGVQLKNMLQTRRIKSAKLVNPAVLMGLRTTPRPSPDKMIEIWGLDPVHANKEGYSNIARCVLEEAKTDNVVFARKPSCSAAPGGTSQGDSNPLRRESWTASSQKIADRRDAWKHPRGGGRQRGGGHRGGRGGQRGRGGRGGKGAGCAGFGGRPY